MTAFQNCMIRGILNQYHATHRRSSAAATAAAAAASASSDPTAMRINDNYDVHSIHGCHSRGGLQALVATIWRS